MTQCKYSAGFNFLDTRPQNSILAKINNTEALECSQAISGAPEVSSAMVWPSLTTAVTMSFDLSISKSNPYVFVQNCT